MSLVKMHFNQLEMALSFHAAWRDDVCTHPNKHAALDTYRNDAQRAMLALKDDAANIIQNDLANSDATPDELERLTRMMLRSWLILAGWPDDWEVPK